MAEEMKMGNKRTARFFTVLAAYAVITLGLPLLCAAMAAFLRQDTVQLPQEQTGFAEALPQTLPQDETAGEPAAQTALLWDAGTDTLLELPMQEYLLGAAASEMPQSFPDEAIKAQIVAVHSYYEYCRRNACFELEQGAVLQVNTQRREGYLTPQVREQLWGDWTQQNTQRMQQLTEAAGGLLLTYAGEPAAACYHAQSAGSTAAAQDIWGEAVPYLVSVDSSQDKQTDGWQQTLTFTYQQMYDVLAARFVGPDLSGDPTTWFGGVQATPQGYVQKLQAGGAWIDAADLRTWLGLRSTCMEISAGNGVFTVTTRGYGHGVGMSQHGAATMAQAGASCEQILSHYYPGTQLSTVTL